MLAPAFLGADPALNRCVPQRHHLCTGDNERRGLSKTVIALKLSEEHLVGAAQRSLKPAATITHKRARYS